MPPYLQAKRWHLLFARSTHGTSYATLRRSCADRGELLVLVADGTAGFGGLFSAGFRFAKGFFGTGEAFLFRVEGEVPVVYTSTGLNDMFCFADEEGFGLGSDPLYGLFIEKSLVKGSTHGCRTFNNEPLTATSFFPIVRLEIYGFQEPDS